MTQLLAIYDMDKTITHAPTWTPFLIHTTRTGGAPWRLALVPVAALAAAGYLAKLMSRGRLKHIMQRMMLGKTLTPAQELRAAEAFADRAYRADGTLVSRSEPGAVLTDPTLVAARAVAIATEHSVTAVDGTAVKVEARSICIHGDTPGAAYDAHAAGGRQASPGPGRCRSGRAAANRA